MKRTPWVLLILNSLILFALACLASLLRVKPADVPVWLSPLAVWVRRDVEAWILGVTTLGIVVQIGEKSAGIYAVRKRRVQAILDHIVTTLLDADPRKNRCTLFRAVGGWRAAIHVFGRIWWQDDRLLVLRDISRLIIDPFGTYLYAYVRASGSRNGKSCAVWKVYHNREDGCEGVAGQVWLRGYYAVSQKQRLDASYVRKKLKSVTAFEQLKPQSRIAQYAKGTHIATPHQLRARQRMARHFVGSVIETQDGSRRWGVLLMDSVRDKCPFPEPDNPEHRHFKEQFDRYAGILSALLA